MPKINFVEPDGSVTEVEVPVGWSVMEGAVQNGIEGIAAECGGGCACATCHVFVDDAWLGKLAERSDMEVDMLECTAEESTPNSRLSCQIKVTEEHDGLVVRLPESQT
jgi:ferredoxin, 2Fe-2S